MDFITNFPLFMILCSLFSGVLCYLLTGKAARRYTICYEILLLVMAVLVLIYTVDSGKAFTCTMGEFPAPWGNEIRAGVLEALMAVTFLLVMLCSVTAGSRFIQKDIDRSKKNLFYALVNLMTAAIMALVWTNDLFSGYVFLEILTLTSCGVLIVREIGRTTLAAVRYMILNLLGSGLFLLGIALLYDLTGHLLMVPMQKTIAGLALDPSVFPVLSVTVGILTIGLCIKSGLFPFHFWMPDTYGWATPTAAALLSSLVSKAYIFLLIKIYYRAIGIEVIERMPVRNILMVLGVMGMVFGSLQAIHANNLNHMVALSSAAQIGYIYMGIGLGGQSGFTAAVFHIMTHALTKSLLFLTTPRLALVSGNSLLFRNLQGSGKRDRDAGVFFTIGALSMIGIPIFAGFASKLQFGLAAAESGYARMMLVMIALALSSMLNAIYFIRTVIRIYAVDKNRPSSGAGRSRPSRVGDYILPMGALTAANVFLGLFSWVVVDLIHRGFGMFG